MSKIRSLEKTIYAYPNFKLDWKVGCNCNKPYSWEVTDECGNQHEQITKFINPKFGEVERIVICDDNGNPLYDQYQILEGPEENRKRKPGAIIIPYFLTPEHHKYSSEDHLFIGMLQRYREVPIDNLTGKQGRVSLELPRGFANLSDKTSKSTALRELGEETGKVAKSLTKLGEINPNTAFYATAPSVYAAEVKPSIISKINRDAKEQILKCDFLHYSRIKEKIKGREIFCGLTLGALAMFDAYMRIEGKWRD